MHIIMDFIIEKINADLWSNEEETFFEDMVAL